MKLPSEKFCSLYRNLVWDENISRARSVCFLCCVLSVQNISFKKYFYPFVATYHYFIHHFKFEGLLFPYNTSISFFFYFYMQKLHFFKDSEIWYVKYQTFYVLQQNLLCASVSIFTEICHWSDRILWIKFARHSAKLSKSFVSKIYVNR